jgi:phosphatidylserine/phosphatidylglycerophosphate/cardiolipin synthase-like enzyme
VIGWVGLAWLAPVIGSLLYLVFGINRIQRSALALGLRQAWASDAHPHPPDLAASAGQATLQDDPGLAGLDRLCERLTGGPLLPGNLIEVLDGGDAAYPAMLAAIAGAKRSITLASYIFDNDAVGQTSSRHCGARARGRGAGADRRPWPALQPAGHAARAARRRRHARAHRDTLLPARRNRAGRAEGDGLRGVAMNIVLPARSNLRVMDWATRPQLPELLDSGCRVHLSPAPFDHTKLLPADERWALIGSTNWDARRLRLNFEYNLTCIDEQLVQQLDTLLAARLHGARRLAAVELLALPIAKRLRNGIGRLMSPYL